MVTLDPNQREHELADALLTLIIALSRYGDNDQQAQLRARLAVIAAIAVQIADEVAARIGKLEGEAAAQQFRGRLGRNTSANRVGRVRITNDERPRRSNSEGAQ
jgi:hypothetical protein